MQYNHYLLDADETLYDFPLAQERAVTRALEGIGWPMNAAEVARFDAINARLWKLRETGGITQDELVIRRFTEFLGGDARFSDTAAARAYIEALSQEGPMLPGALDVVKELKRRGAKIAIVTNGVGKTQRGRFAVSGIGPYVDALVISEEVGAFKPDPRMIFAALEALGCADKSHAVMVGDSLSTDMLAAQRAGIAACWYNPHRKALPEGLAPPDHELHDLAELLA